MCYADDTFCSRAKAIARFVIHIGPYKTGSTYLQRCLAENAAALQDAGIVLARMWEDNPLKPSHTGLVHRLVTERRAELEPVFAAWRRSHAGMVVISCEDLSAMSREYVKTLMLRELIGDSPATIVFYVRRWSELLSSEWKEYVGIDSTRLLPFFYLHHAPAPLRDLLLRLDSFETSIELRDDDPAVRDVLANNYRCYARHAPQPFAENAFYRPKIVQAPFIRSEYALSPGFAEAVRSLWTALLDVEKPR